MAPEQRGQLSLQEQLDYARLKKDINEHMVEFNECLDALEDLHNSQEWRYESSSFEEYCQKNFQFPPGLIRAFFPEGGN